MCGSSTTTSQTSTSFPKEFQPLVKAATSRATDIAGSPFQSFGGDRVAEFSGDQSGAMDLVRQWASFTNPGETMEFLKNSTETYANTPAYNERVVDEGGYLGNISDYINPYIQNALNPTIREIGESGARQRNEIDAGATMAGAFGDSAHGIITSEQMRGETEAISDASYKAYADAFGLSMQQRTGDRDSKIATSERGLDRLFTGGQAGGQNFYDVMSLLFGSGDRQQQQEQSQLDTQYEEFLRSGEWPFRGLDALTSVLSGAPTTQTTTSTQPDNSLGGLIGGLLGGIF